MGWLTTQVENHGADFEDMLIASMHQSGVYDAVFALCGPFGVRRFMLRFATKGYSFEIREIETLPLQYGGGTPSASTPANLHQLKTALRNLQSHMGSWAPWHQGTLGVVRDCDNKMQVIPFFDEDVEGISVEHLPIPSQGHPLEDRAYLKVKASVQAQLEPVYMNTMAISHDWTEWAIDGEELRLIYQDNIESTVEKKRCRVLAIFDQGGQWTWQVRASFCREVFCWDISCVIGKRQWSWECCVLHD